MAEQEPGRRDYNQSHWCVNLMDISPPPAHTPPSFFLYVSLGFITLCFFFFFYYKAPREDIYVHVHFSWNGLLASLPVAALHSLKVISSLTDKTRIWETVSHPLSQMRKTGEGMAISTPWHQQKKTQKSSNRGSQFMRSLFACDNHNLQGGRDMDFIQFFNIYCQKYWQYMWKQEKQLSGYIF